MTRKQCPVSVAYCLLGSYGSSLPSRAAPCRIVMSMVFNVSDDFGKLLLEGWVCEQSRLSSFKSSHNLKTPSDLTCIAEGCRGIPLLRSPEGHNPVTWFCTSCKGDGSGESFALVSACLTFRLCNSPQPQHWSESIGAATPLFT